MVSRKKKQKKPARPPSPKMMAFARAVVELGSASAAYRQVYAARKMAEKTVEKRASELRHDPRVAEEIERLQAELREQSVITVGEIVAKLATIFRLDFGELLDEDGHILPLSQIPEEVRRCIDGYRVKTIATRTGDIIEAEVKIPSRISVGKELMKHLGGYLIDHMQRRGNEEAGATPNLDGLSDEDLSALPDELLNAYLRRLKQQMDEAQGGQG